MILTKLFICLNLTKGSFPKPTKSWYFKSENLTKLRPFHNVDSVPMNKLQFFDMFSITQVLGTWRTSDLATFGEFQASCITLFPVFILS